MRLLAVIVTSISLAACATQHVPPTAVRAPVSVSDDLLRLVEKRVMEHDETYRIRPGDEVTATVYGADDLNTTARVTSAGTIYFPLLGSMTVEGLTEEELRQNLELRYGSRYVINPSVTVFVSGSQPPTCRILGAVSRPGSYEVRPGDSLLDLISMAGGTDGDVAPVAFLLPAESRDELVAQVRSSLDPNGVDATTGLPHVAGHAPAASPTNVQIPLQKLIEEGDPRVNVPLRDGDTFTVISAESVYVTGAVAQPGAIALQPNMTLTQALALAGGEDDYAILPSTRIMRRNPEGGEAIRITADVRAILDSRQPDIELQPEDVIFVPASALRAAYNEAFRYLTVLAIFGLRLF